MASVEPPRMPHVAKGNGLILLPRPRLSNEDGDPRGLNDAARGSATYCFILALRGIFRPMCV